MKSDIPAVKTLPKNSDYADPNNASVCFPSTIYRFISINQYIKGPAIQACSHWQKHTKTDLCCGRYFTLVIYNLHAGNFHCSLFLKQ
jgi:hypothetical protein